MSPLLGHRTSLLLIRRCLYIHKKYVLHWGRQRLLPSSYYNPYTHLPLFYCNQVSHTRSPFLGTLDLAIHYKLLNLVNTSKIERKGIIVARFNHRLEVLVVSNCVLAASMILLNTKYDRIN
jgi:hypothetical protein